MRVVIGQRTSPRSNNVTTPRGAAAGAVAGCGCGGAPRTNPQLGWKPGISRGNPGPQARVGVRYGGSVRQPICYRGINGQLVCPNNEINMRASAGTMRRGIERDWFEMPNGTVCAQRPNGDWHCVG